MPEVHFTIRWPDGKEERCYSPSTAIRSHLAAGADYALPDFLARARTGLNQASDRVAAKYGFACSSAMDQLTRIEARSHDFAAQPDARVSCTAIEG